MIYGHNRTVHQSGEVNVEVDSKGRVVSVWFRCAMLPFNQRVADGSRAKEMTQAYQRSKLKGIVAIEFSDEPYTGHENENSAMGQLASLSEADDK